MNIKTWLALAVLVLLGVAACGIATKSPSNEPTKLPTSEPTSIVLQPLRVVQIGAMLEERAAHQATLLPTDHVLITGGCAGRGCDRYLDSVELFDPDTQSFEPGPPMSTPRAGHVASALGDGRVLVAGGWTGQGATASGEIYDPATGRWTVTGDMADARESLMAVTLADGRVLVTGGSGGVDDLASAEVFDPSTSTFAAVGPMETNHYLATALADGRVLLTGGQDAAGEILGSAEIFDPTTGGFLPAGEMAVPRIKHAGALLADGRVLILGGSDTRGYSGRFTSTELYNPATGVFSTGPDMAWGRHKIRDAVVMLPSGAVLVAGGALRPELFDPVDQVFVAVEGELSGPQMFATATLLSGGDVLILGGYDDRTQPSDGAWLVHSGR
jgi:hypothetical protein